MSETLIVEFGAGEVGVMRTSEQGEDYESGIAFVRQEAHPIGEVVPGRIGKTTDEVGSFLRFHFSNPESLQVVIDDLVSVLASMKAVEHSVHWTVEACAADRHDYYRALLDYVFCPYCAERLHSQ